MKKLSTLLIGALCILGAACSKSGEQAPVSVDGDQQGEPFETVINIRYVSTDSIGQYYVFAQEVKTQLEQIALDLESQRNYYSNLLNQRAATIDQKMKQNQYLTQQSYEQDMKELNRLQSNYSNVLAQKENEAAEKASALQKALSDSISNFLVDFNKTYKYDAILDRAVGLYFNPALDITKEVTDGLNKRYMKTQTGANTTVPTDSIKK